MYRESQQKLVDRDNVSTATTIGYAEYDYILRCTGIIGFGEENARWLFYNKLMGIDRLLNEFLFKNGIKYKASGWYD